MADDSTSDHGRTQIRIDRYDGEQLDSVEIVDLESSTAIQLQQFIDGGLCPPDLSRSWKQP